jgi:hypothetical protein
MGEAKAKQSKRQQVLAAHPFCIYCGETATTTDHCPPRCFFLGRQWPESYEFPSCEGCNFSARKAEQALSVLVRATQTEPVSAEWQKLLQGLRNNQPEIINEWTGDTRNEQKRALRAVYGREEGDRRRWDGWATINLGPLSKEMITRYMLKLSKALYFRHNGHILDGVVYINHINTASKDTTPDLLKTVLSIAPVLPEIKRNNRSLVDQFIYRMNYNPEHGALYAVVQFTEQYVFQLFALSSRMADGLVAKAQADGVELPFKNRFDAFLVPRQ